MSKGCRNSWSFWEQRSGIVGVSVSKGCRNCWSFCEQGVQEQLVFLGARGAGTVLIKAVTEVLVPTFEE